MNPLREDEIIKLAREALSEDLGVGDATTSATVPPGTQARAVMRARETLVVAGLPFARAAFALLGPELQIDCSSKDEDRVPPGGVILRVEGAAAPILGAERVALNFIQRLSGIATLTAQFVELLRGTGTELLDTRKTTPGWRRLEKYAVSCGGGKNHRFGLFDLVLIKDNHLAALRGEEPNAVAAAVSRARKAYPNLRVEVEADHLEQVGQAVDAGADIILLDNMTLAELRQAVRLCQGRAQTEASGGVTLASARAIAECGVNFISVGALTHSARAVDIGLDFEP